MLFTLSDNLIIMSTSLVSSIILESRKTSFNEDQLRKKVTWLYHEIQKRNGNLSNTMPPSILMLRTTLKLLSGFLEKKKDVFELQIKAQKGYKNVMMLSYYRNNLVHIFLAEAYIACSLLGFGESISEEQGIPLQRVYD
jgi:glycerol-3-phosphate O-acyltransferase